MLTGHHAIEKRSNDLETRMAIIEDDFPQAAVYNPRITANTQRILNKATDKNMLQRFQSCQEFALELSSEQANAKGNNSSNLSDRENDDAVVSKVESNTADLENKLVASIRRGKTLKVWLIALIVISIAAIISLIVGVTQYNTLMDEHNTLYDTSQNELNRLNSRYNALQSDYDFVLANNGPIRIDTLTVGNWNNNAWITQPGGTLYASRMRYLSPRIVYTSVASTSGTFYVKIIQPNAAIFRNSSTSPQGYSYSSERYISRGENQTLDLSGWGNGDSSSYWPGTWTVEVWYKGVCLKSEKVRLN
jgi:hypothetical protein